MRRPRYGKLDRHTMDRVVYRSLGARRPEVMVGPRNGFDNAFVSLGGRKVVVVTTDPVSVIPEVGMRLSAWLSVHLVASDLATSGVPPRFATFSFNFPKELRSDNRREYLHSIGSACSELGVAIVGGHTGAYPGGSFTVVGGGTMFGITKVGEYVDPSMARQGDDIIMTKGAAIESSASLAWEFPGFTEKMVGTKLAARARALLSRCSVVEDALAAASVGLGAKGVTSMHDATEGGVLGAVAEMASASGLRFEVDPTLVHVSKEAGRVCEAFGIDPLVSLSEGTLLITCRPGRSRDVSGVLKSKGIESWKIGRVSRGHGVLTVRDGRSTEYIPGPDPYWAAYARRAKG